MRKKGKHFNFIYQGEKNMQKQSQMEALTFTNANPDKVDLTFQRQSEKNDNNHYVQFVFFFSLFRQNSNPTQNVHREVIESNTLKSPCVS